MDPRYCYGLVAFSIGALAGFQGVYERYRKDGGQAATSLPGLLYLLSRGAIPALAFTLLYANRLISDHLLLYALACGTSLELVLRARFYVRQKQTGPADVEDVLRGPFDLLRWYQDWFLELAAERLADHRLQLVTQSVPGTVGFPALCDRVVRNAGAWPEKGRRGLLLKGVEALRTKWLSLGSAAKRDQEQAYRMQLGFLALDLLGERGLKTLLTDTDIGTTIRG